MQKHVQITPFFLRIYSTLKFTYVIEYNRWPHTEDTQTEWNEHELTKWNELQNAEYITTSQVVPVTAS